MDYFTARNAELEKQQDIKVVGDQRCKEEFVKVLIENNHGTSSPTNELMTARSFFYDEMRVYCLSNGIDLIVQKAPMGLYIGPDGTKATIEARTTKITDIRADHHPHAIGRFAALKLIQILKHKYGVPIRVLSLYTFSFDKHIHYCDNCKSEHDRDHLRLRFGVLTEEHIPALFKPIVDDYSENV